MPAPRKFTRERLQSVALQLVDEHGLAGLTMRSLAAELGTGPMTIYNYVDGRDGLERLVTEAVMTEASWPDDPSEDWRQDLRVICEAMWRAVRAHPGAIPLIFARRSLDQATLTWAEALLRPLARGGRAGYELLVAFRAVSSYVAGFAEAELAGPLAAARGDDPQTVIDRVATLSPEQFPHLTAIAAAAHSGDPEIEFRAGLDIVLSGLAPAEQQ